MTVTESAIQPLLFLIFLIAGALYYLPKMVLGWLPIRKRLPVSVHLLEGIWGLFFCLFFGLVSHFAYDGRISYYTILSYLAGTLISALFLKLPMEKLYRFIKKRRQEPRQKEEKRE
jgi:hypothetical protein